MYENTERWMKFGRWSFGPFRDVSLDRFIGRIEQLRAMRVEIQSLSKLLTKHEQTRLNLSIAMEPFEGFPIWNLAHQTEQRWKSLWENWCEDIAEAEMSAVEVLKTRIREARDDPMSLLHEMTRYQILMKRPLVQEHLSPHREHLLVQLESYLINLQSEFGHQIEGHEIVSRMEWLHQLIDKVEECLLIGKVQFQHCAKFEPIQMIAEALLSDIRQTAQQEFSDWSDDIHCQLEDPSSKIHLRFNQKLLELDLAGDGDLVVHYSEPLVALIKESRKLAELGYKMSEKILRLKKAAEKFYKYAIQLKQIAHFYNTMSEQIIDCQKRLLVVEAQQFEQVVRDKNAPTWDNPEGCDAFVNRLLTAAEKLTSKNRKLRNIHETIGKIISRLNDAELIKHKSHWDHVVGEVLAIFSKERRTNDLEAMRIWQSFWDEELSRVLEKRYQSALVDVHLSLPSISVALVTSRKGLVLQPSLEDVRQKLHKQAKKLIDLPLNFQGFTDSDAYCQILGRNERVILKVNAACESSLAKLNELLLKYQPWVADPIFAPNYIEDNITEFPDWEKNFELFQQKRKRLDCLPTFEKIDSFNIDFQPFVRGVDLQIDSFSAALTAALKRSILEDVKTVESFIDISLETLTKSPANLEEMGEAKASWLKIRSEKDSFRQKLKLANRKAKLLRTVASATFDLSNLEEKWRTLFDTCERFNEMLADQKENMRDGVTQKFGRFEREINEFASRWQALKPKSREQVTNTVAAEIISSLQEWREGLKLLQSKRDNLKKECEYFDIPAPSFENLQNVETEIQSSEDNWKLYHKFSSGLEELTRQLWVNFRSRLFDFQDFYQLWQAKVKGAKKTPVVRSILKDVSAFEHKWAIIRCCTGELFENDHWTLLFRKLKLPKSITLKNLTFGDLLTADNLESEEKFIKGLSSRAQGEVTIREALQELTCWCESSEFSFTTHAPEHRPAVTLIKDWKKLMASLGDQQSLLSSLKESPYYGPFADQVEQLSLKFSSLDFALRSLNQIQRKWVYLEPIFYRGALPQEQSRFQRVDDRFTQIMAKVAKSVQVVSLVSVVPNVDQEFPSMLDQLERCQKALSEFLEDKRASFPRFYFIGDDDLLEILGQSKNVAVIQSHLKKLFQGIFRVEVCGGQIVAMISNLGEVVKLDPPVFISDTVEEWLTGLSNSMQNTLQSLLRSCMHSPDLRRFPSQISSVVEAIMFTENSERNIRNQALPQFLITLKQRLDELTGIDCGNDKVLTHTKKSLVLDVIHYIDVVNLLIRKNVTSLDDWEWQRQLRFYLEEDGLCRVRMVDACFEYSYEYQGNPSKLVHTPLTDKCYLVLTQGMHLGFGGNPYGPAGTGKTESVKALARALGRQVLVFNCDEAIDFQSMGRIFVGLVKSGSWGCFDEFNRLKEEQLSAISQQIQIIQAALWKKTEQINLLDLEVKVNFNAGIFVTMNPASKEYGGRSKLPDNLKQLFRSVAMTKPNLKLIVEVILYAEGFKHGKELGHKVCEIYQLSKQLLSNQRHYDWGLRALKTILTGAGNQLFLLRSKKKEISKEEETSLLLQTLIMSTLSKLTYTDAVRFNELIRDVFPNYQPKAQLGYANVLENIRKQIKKAGLQIVESQIGKILQFHEALQQRMGVVVVGPSGCGKTTMWRTLRSTLEAMGQRIKVHVMNPKAFDRTKLLGYMDVDTREWFDGALTAAARQVIAEPSDVHSWIICDGDIDPEWIEALNSVLDDNHLLSMPNGERIQFGNNVNFIFESSDLEYASPATISRMGMIFMSEKDIHIPALVQKWLASVPSESRLLLEGWFDLFYDGLSWVENQSEVIPTTKVGLVMNSLSHLRSSTTKEQFVINLIRGMGANLSVPNREEFARMIFAKSGESLPKGQNLTKLTFDVNAGRTRFYQHVDSDVCKDDISINCPPIIKTANVQQNLDTISTWLKTKESFLVAGPEGCGKTTLLREAFRSLTSVRVATIHCSAQTNASSVINKLQETCSVFNINMGKVYRPDGCERLILFLKDINLPKPDKYRTIQLIAFLQQLVSYQGFYDDNLEFVGVENIQIVCSMTSDSGRYALSSRFTAIMRILCVDYPEESELRKIYSSYLNLVLKVANVASLEPSAARDLAWSMVEVYRECRARFSVHDHKHYVFTPRDITRWVFGLLRYPLTSVDFHDAWIYEAKRVFADRLIDMDARTRFLGILGGVLELGQMQDPRVCFTSLVPGEAACSEYLGPCLSCVPDEDFASVISQGLRNYEKEVRELDILLFPEFLANVARIERVLSQPGGNALLIGSTGVGRRTGVSLVSHMLRIRMQSPAIEKQFSHTSFRTDLKEILRIAGSEATDVIYYVEDKHILSIDQLDDLNLLLASSYIPGLFEPKELDSILSGIKESYQQEGMHCKTLLDFFISRVEKHLHIFISMDHRHPEFSARCEGNPALFSKCNMIWVGSWTEESMAELARDRLQSVFADFEGNEDRLIDHVLQIHLSRKAYPLTYQAFLSTYVNLYREKYDVNHEALMHLNGGLSKLTDATALVDELTQKAEEQRLQLQEKQSEADEALEQITEAMAKAKLRRADVESLQAMLSGEEEALELRKGSIQEELSGIQPMIDKAKKAVGSIRKDAINELRMSRMPPQEIHDLLSGVLILMGNFDTSWHNIKRFLSKSSVKEDLVNFDAHRVNGEIRKRAEALIRENPRSFDYDWVKRKNVAAAPLSSWVQANVQYSIVLEKIAPLENEFATASKELQIKHEQIREAESELKELDSKVVELKESFAKTTAEAEKLRSSLAQAENTMMKAKKLIGKLSDEQYRWKNQVAAYQELLKGLPLEALIASAFITYLTSEPENVRAETLRKWSDLLEFNESFDVLRFLTTQSEILQFKQEGLASDELSLQNAQAILHSMQNSYIIDPTSNAIRWLSNHLETREIIAWQDEKLLNQLELSVRFGKTIVITEMDTAEPLLYPILRRDIARQGIVPSHNLKSLCINAQALLKIFYIFME